MIPALEEPAIRARVPAMSVEQYHRMFEMGALAPNVELVRGALIERMPKSPLHASIVTLLFKHLLRSTPRGFHVRAEQPLTFGDSEPEPDIAVIRGSDQEYFTAHPTTAELVVEVVVSSEPLDRLKLQLYAEAGVPECWLILAEKRTLERHTQPKGSVYAQVERAELPADIESTVFPGLRLPPPGLPPG